eukprot:TRINITY_DN3755_c0_g2_i4.p3 TRINITY_DN3755_c0_g2~~TRINITY_DN3755_c0_g2_i4.p3  ORF type:complete len:143 (+),score=34.07 TRINITY_DN3755_c0_g2_i4:298-726(+)
MAFTKGDEVLVTVGSASPAPLILYCWAQKTVMASTVLNELPLEVQARHIEDDNVTVIVTQTKIYEMTIVDSLTHFEEFCNVTNHRTELKQEALTAGTVIRTNESMPKLSYLSLIHISEPTRPLYISYAVFCLKKKKKKKREE